MGIVAMIERAPTESGGHTTYYLMQYEGNIVKPFPLSNFMLCKQKHREEIESQTKERGFQFVIDN